MRVILPSLPDPTDIVVQGAQILAEQVPLPAPPPPTTPWTVLVAGDHTVVAMTGFPVPRAMIGQHDWYGIKPRTIGPMRQAGGRIEMLDIGAWPVNVFVDPIQKWLNSVFIVDQSGFMMTLYDPGTIGAPEVIAPHTLAETDPIGNPVVTIPRGAIFRSGLIKRITAPVLPSSFGSHQTIDSFVETTRKWFISGVTRDGAGAAIVSARVLVLVSLKVVDERFSNPILYDLVSSAVDGSYLIQVPNNFYYWLIGYKDGAPDRAGSTINEVVPIEV